MMAKMGISTLHSYKVGRQIVSSDAINGSSGIEMVFLARANLRNRRISAGSCGYVLQEYGIPSGRGDFRNSRGGSPEASPICVPPRSGQVHVW